MPARCTGSTVSAQKCVTFWLPYLSGSQSRKAQIKIEMISFEHSGRNSATSQLVFAVLHEGKERFFMGRDQCFVFNVVRLEVENHFVLHHNHSNLRVIRATVQGRVKVSAWMLRK